VPRPPAWSPPECLPCGRCCFSDEADYLGVYGADLARLTGEEEALLMRVGDRAFMRLEDGHCAALRVDVDRALWVCGIYARRPDVCRALERGSSSCKFEHDRKLDRPAVLLERLRRPGPSPRDPG
jgi:uncharacterized protein